MKSIQEWGKGFADQFCRTPLQHSCRRGVHEGRASLKVKAENSFPCGVENQGVLVAEPDDGFFRLCAA